MGALTTLPPSPRSYLPRRSSFFLLQRFGTNPNFLGSPSGPAWTSASAALASGSLAGERSSWGSGI